MGHGSKLKYELKVETFLGLSLSQTFEMLARILKSRLQLKAKGPKLVNHVPMVFERPNLVTV